jgi:hypothetical protein
VKWKNAAARRAAVVLIVILAPLWVPLVFLIDGFRVGWGPSWREMRCFNATFVGDCLDVWRGK